MSINRKAEKALLDHEEWTLVQGTHQPEIKALSDKELSAARTRLRGLHDKQRDLSHAKRRISQGKADPRGGSFPGTYERPGRRKQVFAQAIRRINSEKERREIAAARSTIVESQHRALAKKRRATSTRPTNTPTASAGKSSITNPKRATKVPGAKVGSVSQQTKKAQAKKDR
ncbi:hypothetical protein FJQ54_05930 [Sandaracinobacter neustonicus]|uniref:Uncharacterized protein n=1 Tax=Sandaracinobacter neustonicus TaxID=1715348 RepID=A0A501XPR6_9SPHN|nr:hypothetical protein [Sandaracinobacter neustonicus]TPE62435.1 hypothetical protein FJQ54_05930 [Sandaracinobacter neustonicus]